MRVQRFLGGQGRSTVDRIQFGKTGQACVAIAKLMHWTRLGNCTRVHRPYYRARTSYMVWVLASDEEIPRILHEEKWYLVTR